MTKQLTPDLCVIGAGSAGLSVAAGAVQMGASVVLIEQAKMGGDCLNTGCIPSKSLLAAAKRAAQCRQAGEFGIENTAPSVNYKQVHAHIQRVMAEIAPNDSVQRFTGLGVTVLSGTAHFINSRHVKVGDTTIRAKRFVIATGSTPVIPPIPGLNQAPFLTNETIFNLTELPRHLVVIGGGPIGCELAQAYRLLGSQVTILELGKILPKDDAQCVQIVRESLIRQGVVLHEEIAILQVETRAGITVEFKSGNHLQRVECSHLLVATGRKPHLEPLQLDKAAIAFNPRGIQVDARLRTTNKRVFAIGDAAGSYQFTHVANYHAGIVIRNALFHWPAKVDYHALPWVTYTDPELAHVGQNEAQLKASGKPYRILTLPYADVDRMRAERELQGMIKVVTSNKGHILGVTIVGEHADELITPWVLAMHKGLKISALATMIVPYPTRSEISKRVAGNYFTPALFSAKTRRLVRWLNRFF